MPEFSKKYRILGVEEDILFEVKSTQNFPIKSANLASALNVGEVSFVAFASFKFTPPTLSRDVSSHDAQNITPTLEIEVAVS